HLISVHHPRTTAPTTLSLHDALPISRSATGQDGAAKTHQSATGEIGFRSKLFSPAVSQCMVWRGRQREREFFVGHRVRFECWWVDRKSTRLNSSHLGISYAVFCLKKK